MDPSRPLLKISLYVLFLVFLASFIFVPVQTAANASSKKDTTINRGGSTDLVAPAHSPTSSRAHRSYKNKHRVLYVIVGFITGMLASIINGLFMTAVFRINSIRKRYKNSAVPSIFTPIIKSPTDLAFLERDDLLASLDIIGRGGCGEVYKTELPNNPGKIIAIKRIRRLSDRELTDENSKLLDEWMKQIMAEIKTVGHIRHRNLVPLLAHITRPDCHFLIYEFMKNGSLHDALKRAAEGTRELDWNARLKIARGIAAGLEYLHIDYKPNIIHRDLKPANILLDDDMEARIADFGLAKEIPNGQTHMSTNVAGTFGYIAPEYFWTWKLTEKCDIYSFGVILAVLVTSKFPTDNFFQDSESSLVEWVHNMMSSDDPCRLMDPKLMGNGCEEQMLLVLRIAWFCLVTDPMDRPNSKDVRIMLSKV